MTVWHMNEFATKTLNTSLKDVKCYSELEGAPSGGTLATVRYHMMERPKPTSKPEFDPLLTDRDVKRKSKHDTKVIKAKGEKLTEFDCKASKDWIMAAVMGNCIKRSNALMHYSERLAYYDGILQENGWLPKIKGLLGYIKIGLGLMLERYGLPSLGLIPKPGSGPTRDAMERGSLTLHGRAVCENGKLIKTRFTTARDPGYLDTAKMLVAGGYLLLRDDCSRTGGVVTPAFAFGHHMTDFLAQKSIGMQFVVSEGIY
jgi:short subunit dehydrogenase-like uncharacterized protein